MNKKHVSYLVGYIENEEFFCAQEATSLNKAKLYVEAFKNTWAKDKNFLIFKKSISYSKVNYGLHSNR